MRFLAALGVLAIVLAGGAQAEPREIAQPENASVSEPLPPVIEVQLRFAHGPFSVCGYWTQNGRRISRRQRCFAVPRRAIRASNPPPRAPYQQLCGRVLERDGLFVIHGYEVFYRRCKYRALPQVTSAH